MKANFQLIENTVLNRLSVNIIAVNFVNFNDIQLCTYLIITGGVDYNINSSRVIFPNGITTALLPVSINDDTEFETDETFIISIDPLSLPYGVILGSTASAVVTIVDDDSKLIYTIYLCICRLDEFTCSVYVNYDSYFPRL